MSMRPVKKVAALILSATLLCGAAAGREELGLQKDQAKLAEYKRWLDLLRADPFRFWFRIDGHRRPYRLFVGEGFYRADLAVKEKFVEIFSHYLAGHSEKFMLIDIYDVQSGAQIGELGWGGFKLY